MTARGKEQPATSKLSTGYTLAFDLPLSIEIQVEAGDGVIATAICAPEAARVADAFLSGKPIPQVEALAGELVSPGVAQTMRIEAASCDIVLYTRPSGKTAKFTYLAWPERERTQPFAVCDQP